MTIAFGIDGVPLGYFLTEMFVLLLLKRVNFCNLRERHEFMYNMVHVNGFTLKNQPRIRSTKLTQSQPRMHESP